MGLDPNTGMEYGQDYSFTFKVSATLVPVTNEDIYAAIGQLQDLSAPSVIQNSTSVLDVFNISGRAWDVNFTFAGDDSVATVQSVANEIAAAISSTHYAVSTSFIQAVSGSIGLVASGGADASGQPDNQPNDPNSIGNQLNALPKELLYVGIGILVLVVALHFL
jgi:hypothetical protein